MVTSSYKTFTGGSGASRGKARLAAAGENVAGWLFVLPALLPLLAFWVVPVFYSLFISFTDWDLISKKFNFVLIKNYTSLFRDLKFFKILTNTLIFALGSTGSVILLGFLTALLFSGTRGGVRSRDLKGRGFSSVTDIFRILIFSPYITPMIAVSIVWSWIFEPRVGVLNFILSLFHIPALKWTQSMDTAMLSVIIVTVWKQLGWAMIFYIEAINRVPNSLLEAAIIDGAGFMKRLVHITLPMVSPTTYFLVIISTIISLQAYDQILVLTNGGPAGATRTLLYYYYQEAFNNFSAGKASAVAVIIVLITVLLSASETMLSKRATHYG
ncbi:MAG: sugar ABC transporter permease [Treponema sp.]|jgi:multiple sugar transport system permease protein|nr:sugar ABC transporter permease [Treponema sp.]